VPAGAGASVDALNRRLTRPRSLLPNCRLLRELRQEDEDQLARLRGRRRLAPPRAGAAEADERREPLGLLWVDGFLCHVSHSTERRPLRRDPGHGGSVDGAHHLAIQLAMRVRATRVAVWRRGGARHAEQAEPARETDEAHGHVAAAAYAPTCSRRSTRHVPRTGSPQRFSRGRAEKDGRTPPWTRTKPAPSRWDQMKRCAAESGLTSPRRKARETASARLWTPSLERIRWL
jgi:hypothetical protein